MPKKTFDKKNARASVRDLMRSPEALQSAFANLSQEARDHISYYLFDEAEDHLEELRSDFGELLKALGGPKFWDKPRTINLR